MNDIEATRTMTEYFVTFSGSGFLVGIFRYVKITLIDGCDISIAAKLLKEGDLIDY
ncbi:MAG TPA: hypothetical protein VFI73_08000 [Candidatus Nitrosopolaris sp.]|nr:hypothetical protein [Candidatus Nitrosopolaris sp.]